MVVDTSAIVSIFLDDAEAGLFHDVIRETDEPRMSAASVAETLIVLDSRTRDDNGGLLRDMLVELGMVVEVVTFTDALIAADAYRRFGKGRHRAKLNYGDCFAYALAKSLDLPLLFKGDDFGHTDIRRAL